MTSSIKSHTINEIVEILGETPQSDNLHVYIFNNSLDMSSLSYPFRGNNSAFLLVLSGQLKLQLNLITHSITRDEMVPIKPQTVAHILGMSNDLEFIVISFTLDFILKNSFKTVDFDAFNFFSTNGIPKLKLSESEIKTAIVLSELLEKTSKHKKEDNAFKKEMITYNFGLLFYLYASIFKKEYPTLEVDLSRQEGITLRFLKILNENYRKERHVQFYADVLCMTSGHLSKVLKEVSGKTASQLIDDAVIMEAKILLKNPEITIAEISNELQFSNQSFFGKYFKKYTGHSPTQFRMNVL